MFNNNRSEAVAPRKGDDKVRDIKKELETLGSIKEKYIIDIENGKELSSKYKGLDKDVIKKEKELKIVSDKIAKAERELKVIETKSEDVKVSKEYEDSLNASVKKLKGVEEVLILSIKDLKENKEKEEADLKSAILGLKKDKEKIAKELATFLSTTSKQIERFEDILFELDEQEKKVKTSIAVEEKELTKVEAKKVKALSEFDSIEVSIKEENRSLEIIKKETDEYYDRKIEELNKVEKEKTLKQDERDGELSDKEKFLKIREDFLRDVKSQLEDNLGRKIDNIKF